MRPHHPDLAAPVPARLRLPTHQSGTRTCLFGALLLLAAPAGAQVAGAGIPGGFPQRQAQADGPGIDTRSLRETASPAQESDTGATDRRLPFASSPDLRRATVERHLRSLRATNPIAAAEAGRELAKYDYDAIFRSFLDGTGLDSEDAGDVLTAFIVLQWMVANDATAEPSPAALQAIRRRFVLPMADKPPLSQPANRAAFAEQVKLRAVLHHAGWKAARQLGVMPRFLATLSNEFIPAAKLQALALTEDGLVSKGRSTGPAGARPSREPSEPSPPTVSTDAAPPPNDPRPASPLSAGALADASTPPRHAGNWDAVEGVYFRSTTGVGVGGMVTIDFEPLIVLTDGTYYEIDDTALEDVDLAAERSAKPRRFGRWTRKGRGFVLTGVDGKPVDYAPGDGSFFRAFPAGADERVARSYRRLSGGGNSAMGGDVAVAVESRYDFKADGRYGRGGSVGAVNSGASTGVGTAMGRRRAPEGGQYRLDRHTLTLTGADGRSRRLFFAFGSQKDPPEVDRDMLFIGDSVFSSDD
ncbi:hypothetical protein MPPM_0835 [Methylorubrum populi]|uniref:Uncharacterized protein n=1 Tax=Methylorubrum populi TaxID=223967 RepID=A0A160PDW0_9HYPH|nr:hypothetical protein [Methylorubrum populi]BAU89440.1 hypothetical protein MPPM_0835 [Methylorubrum populi]